MVSRPAIMPFQVRIPLKLALTIVFFAGSLATFVPPSLASSSTNSDQQSSLLVESLQAADPARFLGSSSWEELAFEVLALPLPEGLFVAVEVDGPLLVQSIMSEGNDIDFFITVSGAEAPTHIADRIIFPSVDQVEDVWRRGLRYTNLMKLPAGDYGLRVVIRESRTGALGVRELQANVPAFDRGGAFLLPPFFFRQGTYERWLTVSNAAPVSNAAQPNPDSLLQREKLTPSARPVLTAGRRVSGTLLAYGLPKGASFGRIVLAKDGREVTSAALGVGQRAASLWESLDSISISFETPRVLAGDYELLVELAGTKTPRIPVAVMQEGSPNRGLLWTDLRTRLASSSNESEPAMASSESDPREPSNDIKEQIKKFEARYRKALSLVERPIEARTRLLNLEAEILEADVLEAVKTAEFQVVEDLARREVESLLPIFALHTDMYLIYRERRLFTLASIARSMAEYLCELYAHYGDSEGSRRVAARALASLAGHLQESNLPGNTRRLYLRALEYDPGNEAALLGLATSHEQHAEYSQAIRFLEDLVAAQPDSTEAALRLAINLDRVGLSSRAAGLIEKVLQKDEGVPEWIRSLAFQYKAKKLLSDGHHEAASELLEQASSEIKDNQELLFLLLHAYDLGRQSMSARDLIARFATTTPLPHESARKRYDSWPRASIEAVRRELTEAVFLRTSLVPRVVQLEAGVGQ